METATAKRTADDNDVASKKLKQEQDNGNTEPKTHDEVEQNGNATGVKNQNGSTNTDGDKAASNKAATQNNDKEENKQDNEQAKTESDSAKKEENEAVGSSDATTKPEAETDKAQAEKQSEKEQAKDDKKPEVKAEAKADEPKQKEPEDNDDGCGTLLLCGGANWDMCGRKDPPKNLKKLTGSDAQAARVLWGPARVISKSSDEPLRVKGVFSGCNAVHSVIITESGSVYTFGRNEKGQLGTGDTNTRITPTHIKEFDGLDIIGAACGRSHTLFMGSDGVVYACGDNKMGQCGTNQRSLQQILTPTRTTFTKKATKVVCGAEFSIILDSQGDLFSFGHPEYGQLGHNSEEKYFTSGNKYAYNCEYSPRKISTYVTKTNDKNMVIIDNVVIKDVACGTNHSIAVDSKGRCYSWGFGGYHRLGHCETANVHVPRSIKVFEAPENSTRGAVSCYAGSSHSMAIDVNGVLFFWGQNKSSGEATMYPKVVQDLCGWKIQSVSCANRSIFVVAEGCCISWGPSPTYGELGYGEGRSKSSTTPEKVRSIDGVQVTKIACGFAHTLLIAKDRGEEDQKALAKVPKWP